MSSILESAQLTRVAAPNDWWKWLPVVIGLAVLYLPTFYDLNRTLWNDEEHLHGPIVLMVVVWLFWHKRNALLSGDDRPAVLAGAGMLALGLLLYVFGRSQAIILFEVGSIIPVLSGLIVFLRGWQVLRRLWFPLLFIVFMVPLPGILVDALTGPLKHQVSVIAEALLYAGGYPIARNGIVLTIGQYQLLVADACSGLNSMYSLSAMGLLYLYLMHYSNRWRNGVLIASILPIAFAANIMRVLILVLITYHFGDEAGQGFVHGLAGIVLFLIALSMLFALDAALGVTLFKRQRRG